MNELDELTALVGDVVEARRPGAKPTQGERLLAFARAGHVLDQNDWWDEAPDGGPPIKALRTRISNLEALGFKFDHVCRRGRLAQYSLISEPCDVQPQDEAALEDTPAVALDEQLPLPLADRARVGHYDCWDA